MQLTLETLEAEALKLSKPQRTRLVERLIASLDTNPEIEAAWAAEAERRQSEIERGAVSPVVASDVVAKLKAEFG